MSGKSWNFSDDPVARDLARALRRQSGVEEFDLAIILGSGWSPDSLLADVLADFCYADWSCFPAGQIGGHAGRLIAARFGQANLLVFCGRFHCYQGLSAFDASFPVRLASHLGCSKLLLTCATGGIRSGMATGDVMMVDDHLNLLGDNPLRGLSGDSFVDLSDLYRTEHFDALQQVAADLPLNVHRGVLAAIPGPSYETPAEVRMLAQLGADVVSMSTVPEAIMGRYLHMEVVALAMIANAAAGLGTGTISHEDVLAKASANHSSVCSLLKELLVAWLSSS